MSAGNSERAIFVKHNAEIAHRLSLLPGKCQQIHGHSLHIEVELGVRVNGNGIAEDKYGPLDFGLVKQKVRGYIDTEFDHRLLMNAADSLIDSVMNPEAYYPGLVRTAGDPTIEHISQWIGEWTISAFSVEYASVRVDETGTNGATWTWVR